MYTMKKSKFKIINSALLLSLTALFPCFAGGANDSLTVFSTPAVSELAGKFAGEYHTANPGKSIGIVSAGYAEIQKNLQSGRTFALMQGDEISSISNGADLWKLVVAHDVIVPVINASNPFMNQLSQRGVTGSDMALIFENNMKTSWEQLLGSQGNSAISVFCPSDESISGMISEFTGEEITMKATVQDAGGVISAVKNNPLALGFCRLSDIQTNDGFTAGLALLPIDKNGNRSMDAGENIYTDPDSFRRGVWIGKYPRSLFRNIYAVSASAPTEDVVTAFLNWIVNDGQNMLAEAGYSDLIATERLAGTTKLSEARVPDISGAANISIFTTLIITLAIVLILGFLIDYIIRYFSRRPAPVVIKPSSHQPVSQDNIVLPKGIYFDKTHTWAFLEQNGFVKVGIDDFIRHITGEISKIKMKNPGDKVNKGDEIVSIVKNGKQLTLYSPVSGIITECNRALESGASVINSSPYEEGWIYRIEPENWQRENQLLSMTEKHRQFIAGEISKIRDFLAGLLSEGKGMEASLVLQDGGMLSDGILSDLEPEVWEEFQTRFIDPSRQVWFYELF
jgi:glycine cleavage system H lipoate-binding protein/ABC-type phosphate transport system substrate-binding protein